MTEALTIADAARVSGVTAHTLRYYERVGLLEPVQRAGGGHRRYRSTDLTRIQFLTKLRSTGMPIRKVREYAQLLCRGDETHQERLELLQTHYDAVKARLLETQHTLVLIERKIALYREKVASR